MFWTTKYLTTRKKMDTDCIDVDEELLYSPYVGLQRYREG